MITGTITAWALSIGITRETLVRALVAAGMNSKPKKLSAREVFNALTGDKEAAMTRKLNAEAEAKERENRIAAGEVIDVESASQIYGKKIAALVQNLDAMPAMIPGLTLNQRTEMVSRIERVKQQARDAK